MAADPTKSRGSTADSYLGCFISLISKAEIRYEGSLFHLNPKESTIGLRNVKSFGTEGRRKDGPQVLPIDKVYEYICFRGSDIKDLQVLSSPPVQIPPDVPNDPAIIQPHCPCSTSASSRFLSGCAVPATNISCSVQLADPNSTFQGILPQPPGSSWSSDSLPPPPTENGNAVPHYPRSTSASSSFLSASAIPATNIWSSAQLGKPNSTFQGILPMKQPVGSSWSWDSLLPPPAENGNAVPPHNPCSTSASSSFLSARAVPATNMCSSAQLGPRDSNFRILPQDQPVGSSWSWDLLPPPATENGDRIAKPTYWPGHIGSSGGVSHLQQQSLLELAQGLPLFPPVQQQVQNPSVNASLPGDASNSAEFSHPKLPTAGTGSASLASTMPPPSALPTNVHIRHFATLLSKLSPNLMPNNISNALSTATLHSNSSLDSALMASSLDVIPVLPPAVDKPRSVYQAISQSMPSVGGLSSPVQTKASIPFLLTPGQHLQPRLTGQSSPHLMPAHKDIEVDQASTTESLSSDSESYENPAQPLPSPSVEKSNGAAFHSNHTNKRQAQGRGNMFFHQLNKTALHTGHSERGSIRGKGNWLNGAALHSHHSYRVQARGRGNRLHGHSDLDSNRGYFWGQENWANTAAVHTHRSYRGCGWGRGYENTTAVLTHHSNRGRGWGKGNQEVYPAVTKFTEDFDFEAMNEKFNKKEIWGHLGKSNIIGLEDNEGEEDDSDSNESEDEEEDEDEVKPFYVKDNFFDTLSCNSLNRESGRGRVKFSEQRRIDIETFGEIPRRQRGRGSRGRGWGWQSRGSRGSSGRGYSFNGRGRVRTVWKVI